MAKLQERKSIEWKYINGPPQFHIFTDFGDHNLTIIAFSLPYYTICVQFAATSEATFSPAAPYHPPHPLIKGAQNAEKMWRRPHESRQQHKHILNDFLHPENIICTENSGAALSSIHDSVGGNFIVVYIVNLYFFTTCFHYFSRVNTTCGTTCGTNFVRLQLWTSKSRNVQTAWQHPGKML